MILRFAEIIILNWNQLIGIFKTTIVLSNDDILFDEKTLTNLSRA